MDINLFIVDRQATRIRELNNAALGSISWVRNGAGQGEFRLDSHDPDAPAIFMWKHELQVVIDGTLRWWGVIWDKQGTPGKCIYKCEDLLSLFKKRHITTTSLEMTSEDQADIAWALVDYAQTPQGTELDNKDLNILQHTSFPITGKARSRIYERNEHENIYDLLEEFPELDDGFDYGIEYDLTGRRDFQVYYPAQGSFRGEFRLEYGRNITDYKITESATNQINDGYATGGSDGEILFEGHYTDDTYANEWGLMTGVWSEGGQTDPDWLLDKATQGVNKNKDTPVELDVKAISVPIEMFAQIGVGDRLEAVIDDGANFFSGYLLVEAITLDPAKENLEVKVTVISDPENDPILGVLL